MYINPLRYIVGSAIHNNPSIRLGVVLLHLVHCQAASATCCGCRHWGCSTACTANLAENLHTLVLVGLHHSWLVDCIPLIGGIRAQESHDRLLSSRMNWQPLCDIADCAIDDHPRILLGRVLGDLLHGDSLRTGISRWCWRAILLELFQLFNEILFAQLGIVFGGLIIYTIAFASGCDCLHHQILEVACFSVAIHEHSCTGLRCPTSTHHTMQQGHARDAVCLACAYVADFSTSKQAWQIGLAIGRFNSSAGVLYSRRNHSRIEVVGWVDKHLTILHGIAVVMTLRGAKQVGCLLGRAENVLGIICSCLIEGREGVCQCHLWDTHVCRETLGVAVLLHDTLGEIELGAPSDFDGRRFTNDNSHRFLCCLDFGHYSLCRCKFVAKALAVSINEDSAGTCDCIRNVQSLSGTLV
mmetsp:Transcript_28924/g.67337  ORF Transcript_28924/g.67337 Transcript_28924/m.67337 type:complete len:412 (+) Transcript_28924:1331-2566(+)